MAHGSLLPKHLSPNFFSPLYCSASAINTTYFAVTTGKQRALIDENHSYTKTAVIADGSDRARHRFSRADGDPQFHYRCQLPKFMPGVDVGAPALGSETTQDACCTAYVVYGNIAR